MKFSFIFFFFFLSFFTYANASEVTYLCKDIEIYQGKKDKKSFKLCADSGFDTISLADVLTNITLGGYPIKIDKKKDEVVAQICHAMYGRRGDIVYSKDEIKFFEAINLNLAKKKKIQYNTEIADDDKGLKTVKYIECQPYEFYAYFVY